jgi:predicted transcriptional regulator
VEIDAEDYLAHYGILRRSGRYPWGSGEDPETRARTFLGMVKDLRDKGLSETEIAKAFDMNTSDLRNTNTIANEQKKQADILMAQRLKNKGYSNVAIGERMGINESSVRALLKPGEIDKANVTQATANMLKDVVEEKKYVDIGSGVERHLGVTSTKLGNAVARLQDEGYTVHYVKIEQLGTGKYTTVKVLAAPDTPYQEVYANRDKIQQVRTYSQDGGRTYDRILPPMSIDSKRVAVRYAEQGGSKADGVIYVRPGVKDVSLGNARYAQVRIAVDGTHYLKGMAVYKEDLPPGVDLMFNTNKSSTGNKLDAMKPMKDDAENPFGATIDHQIGERDSKGKQRLTSVMNIVNEEGDWEEWSKTLSSQMLSKQSNALAKKQLGTAYDNKKDELDDILSVENNTVKRRLLMAYADSADSSAVHLKAAALPRQASHVILPVESLKDTEIYAPNFNNGERVVLVRFPHGSISEIPELTVNNRNPEAKKLLGTNPKDAVGINSRVAARMSGADFDGDTVLVIPNNNKAVKTEPTLEGLKNFDPQMYKLPDDSPIPRMDSRTKGIEMGKISNLITDMTLQGAPRDEIARAIRHSMVVIDAEKHNLNYKQSAIDNGIPALNLKYQGKRGGGAATLISRGNSDIRVPARRTRIDPVTGAKVHDYTGETYIKRTVNSRTGVVTEKELPKLQREKSKKLAETDDARTLISDAKTPIEFTYADYSNRMKELANRARREMLATKPHPYSPEARVKYANEVESLEAALNLALRNSPLERQAQIIGNAVYEQKKAANPDLDKAELKKLRARELMKARNQTGAKKQDIKITPTQWEAIQAGALTAHKLTQILEHADLDEVKKLATPKSRAVMDSGRKSRAISMLRNGYTQAEVAGMMGVSVTTLKRNIAAGDE